MVGLGEGGRPCSGWLQGRGGQFEAYCHRAMLDAVRYLVDNGTKWRAVPADFPRTGSTPSSTAGATHEFRGDRLHRGAGGGSRRGPVHSGLARAGRSGRGLWAGLLRTVVSVGMMIAGPAVSACSPYPAQCWRTGTAPRDRGSFVSFAWRVVSQDLSGQLLRSLGVGHDVRLLPGPPCQFHE